jgi:hypothetical protein
MSLCVITAGEKLPDLPLLAQVFAAAHGTDRSSAAITARHCWGLLGRGLDEAAAAGLTSLCSGLRIKTLTLPDPALMPLPAPQLVKKVIFENGSALFTGAGSQLTAALPADIAILAAAPIKEDFLKTVKTAEGPSAGEKAVRMGIMAVTGLPIGMGKAKETSKEVKSSELSFYLDILLKGGARLRLNSGAFDFSGLKEKKTYSSQVNFRALCAGLTAFAPAAFRNGCVLAMEENRPLTLLPYDSLADLETEELRLTLAKEERHE